MRLKVGMVAPTKAGKTTLLAATSEAIKEKLVGNAYRITANAADEVTRDAMRRAIVEYKTCMSGEDVFSTPQLRGTTETTDYKYTVTIPVEGGAPQHLNFWWKDFPGGLVGMAEFDNEVGPFINESVALVVPLPSDILMAWKDSYNVNDKMSIRVNMAAGEALDFGNVCNVIRNWIAQNAGKDILLMFAPIRCEAYFNDNGGADDKSDRLFRAIEELYIEPLELTPTQKKHVQVEAYAVDTYGTVELKRVKLVESPVGDLLESEFQKRIGSGHNIRAKGAAEVFTAICHFELAKIARTLEMDVDQLREEIANRSFFGRIWDWVRELFGRESPKRSLLQAMQRNECAYQAMAVLDKCSQPSEMRHRVYNRIGD